MSANMTNNMTCDFSHVDELMKVLELVFYIPIFVFGLILNIAALVVFCGLLRKKTESTIYMMNLALMDLLLLFPLPFKMHATNNKWDPNLQGLCSVLEGLYFYGIYGSIYIIMCIAVDRWVAICHPFKAKELRSPKMAVGACVVVWVLVFAAIFPAMSQLKRHKDPKEPFHCFHEFSKNGWQPAIIISVQVFGFVVPALVVVCCSAKIIWALQQSGQHSSQSRACVKIIYSSLCAFLVPFTPSHLGIFLQFLVHRKVIYDCGAQTSISLFLQIAMCLSNITCCLDAMCYYFIAREVRSTRHSFRMSIMSQRRATNSTSERDKGDSS
ncbi:G-protein coupled receptor 55 [Archocentrus centrarchus]|uniref:G-protein coupled receptor 55 n=1 Tax=Archocentrus centrarchus TaxID=63155 RepID=UPI0011E9F2E6|nr:G-protein coupled receptor 55-like [Archocentrus centrarchus]